MDKQLSNRPFKSLLQGSSQPRGFGDPQQPNPYSGQGGGGDDRRDMSSVRMDAAPQGPGGRPPGASEGGQGKPGGTMGYQKLMKGLMRRYDPRMPDPELQQPGQPQGFRPRGM